VILMDTSAWVEFPRATGSPIHLGVRSMLESESVELATADVVVMELLGGARDDGDREELRRLVYGLTLLVVAGPSDYEQAAELRRACREEGETPRNLTDCLIAAVAIRSDAELLHADADFRVIARHTLLRLTAQ
jgi:predicted nucleic acid-binding protein